jgi:glycosyltransferase involved in cell wall biosynthesis
MEHNSRARLNIGLPVYNGENFLEAALESILSQTFREFELIISDNGSTDRTEAICRSWAARDRRIRYIRNENNIGAAPNFNRVFELSDAQYFKWIAHDDMHEPHFLDACIEVLDRDPSTVVAYSRAVTIDSEGNRVRNWGCSAELGSPDPCARFRASLRPPTDPLPLPIFGVIRSDALRNTPLQAGYAGCDRALLAELSLYGRFHEIPEPLFLQREHKDRAGPVLARNPEQARTFWMGTPGRRPDLPSWQNLFGYRGAVSRAPLSFRERLRCYREILVWMGRERKALLNDLMRASGSTPVLGPYLQHAYTRYRERAWQNDIRRLTRDIECLVPEDTNFILVDEGSFAGSGFARRYPIAFLERDGQYWGPPANDDDAIRALEAMRQRGARFLIVSWPAFWWLEYYTEWSRYMQSRFKCLARNDRIVAFDLQSIDDRADSPLTDQVKTVTPSEDGKQACC